MIAEDAARLLVIRIDEKAFPRGLVRLAPFSGRGKLPGPGKEAGSAFRFDPAHFFEPFPLRGTGVFGKSVLRPVGKTGNKKAVFRIFPHAAQRDLRLKFHPRGAALFGQLPHCGPIRFQILFRPKGGQRKKTAEKKRKKRRNLRHATGD